MCPGILCNTLFKLEVHLEILIVPEAEMLLTSSTEIRTIQFGISYFTNEFFSDYVGMFAAVVVSILPSITVFVLFQERVITGLTAGSVKG